MASSARGGWRGPCNSRTNFSPPASKQSCNKSRSSKRLRYVEAQGDYARLHTADTSHLIRVPLSEATRELKLVPQERYAESEVFFG